LQFAEKDKKMDHSTNKKNPSRHYKYSICTPCFNSSNTIKVLYESLERLSFKDFEWIVVNDGSDDDTSLIIKKFIEKASFDIDFYDLNENKMVTYCYNFLVKKSKGEFLILLDHDDMIKQNALDRFNFYLDSFNIPQDKKIAGIISNCDDENGNLVGTPFPNSPFVDGFFEIMFDHGVRGEKFFCYKTEIMKEFNFPLEDKYVPESTVMWNISSKYKTIFINESLRTYVLPQKESNNLSFLDRLDYSEGFRFNYLELLNRHGNKLVSRPYLALAFSFNYLFLSFNTSNFFRLFSDIKQKYLKFFALVLYLPVLTYWYIRTTFSE